jgi:uncharacterized protein (TIGR02268 family)
MTRRGIPAIAAAAALFVAFDPGSAAARQVRTRTVTVGTPDAVVPELHVAPGYGTVLTFQSTVREAKTLRAAAALFQTLAWQERNVIVLPKQVVKTPVMLVVTMTDGATFSFSLVTKKSVDMQVNVLRAAVDSPEALQRQVGALSTQLGECRDGSEKMGPQNVASFILSQSTQVRGREQPQVFESHELRGADKQSRLLVEARRVYRVLGYTFVVLSVDNRDPQRSWILGRPEVRVTGSKNSELTVDAQRAEQLELLPDNQERVIIGFRTPPEVGPKDRYTITLKEKDGLRQAQLTNLEL